MVVVARRSSLTDKQKELIARLEKGETVTQIAEETSVSRQSLYARLERLQFRGVLEHVGKDMYRRAAPKQKTDGMIRRVVLQVTHNPKELSAEEFDKSVARALNKLNTALSDGYEVITQQLYSTSSGEQLVYILHKK